MLKVIFMLETLRQDCSGKNYNYNGLLNQAHYIEGGI